MSAEVEGVVTRVVKSQEEGMELLEDLIEVARPQTVFGEPVNAAGYTVIPASEVYVGMGFGYGMGAGSAVERAEGEPMGEGEERTPAGYGGGGGGGGGGASLGRPVAVISIGANGVRVKPVVDPTKIALALFTTVGSMFFMLSRMRRAARG